MLTRRAFMAAASAASLSACTAKPPEAAPPPAPPPMPDRYGAIYTEPHPVPGVPDGVVDEKLWRQEVDNPFPATNGGDHHTWALETSVGLECG